MSIEAEIARIKDVRRNKRSEYDTLFEKVKKLVDFVMKIQGLRANVAWGALLHENQKMKSSWDSFERLLKETKFISRVNAIMTVHNHNYVESGALKIA